MSNRWRFTPTELLVVWPMLGVSGFPYPFDVRASGTTTDEWARLQDAARARLSSRAIVRSGRLDADVEAALRTLLRPEVSVDAYGFFGDRDESVVRVLGAHTGGSAVLAVQLPGRSEHVGGELTVEVMPAPQLAAAVAAALPPAPRGHEPALRLASSELTRERSDVVVQPVAPTPSQRGRAQLAVLTQGPLAGAGQFGVSAFSGDHPVRTGALRWFDRPGDGRYLMSTGSAVTVRAADVALLASALDEQLGQLPVHA